MSRISFIFKMVFLSVFGGLVLGLCACGTSPGGKNTDSAVASTDMNVSTVSDSVTTDTDSSSVSSETTIVLPIYEENFDDASAFGQLDSIWTNCTEWIRQDGGSKWCNELVEVRDGNLVLKAVWNETENRVDCGAVWTKDQFDTVGGYYEARIRFPVAKGIWGAFWIMAGNVGNVDGTSTDGAEIDIIESIDNDKGAFQAAVHWDGYASDHQMVTKSVTTPDIYDGEFHVFGFERSKGKYVFYVDGVKMWQTKAEGLCILPGYMILSLEGTYGRGVGTAASIKSLPAEMEVDYVRVYATRPQ